MRSALVIYSGGKDFDFRDQFQKSGFGLMTVASHRIEFTEETFPFGRRIDRVLFTSRNAVCAVLQPGSTPLPEAPLYAVGPATKRSLERRGLVSSSLPRFSTAADLAAHLPARLDGEFLFWPRGEDADPWLAKELERRGAQVYAPVVYKKIPLDMPATLSAELRNCRHSIAAFTSAAAARWLFAGLDPEARRIVATLPAAALGPSTESALRDLGVARIALSAESSFESLADLLLDALGKVAAPSPAG
jgi:uroporphyrinogen-III synthase